MSAYSISLSACLQMANVAYQAARLKLPALRAGREARRAHGSAAQGGGRGRSRRARVRGRRRGGGHRQARRTQAQVHCRLRALAQVKGSCQGLCLGGAGRGLLMQQAAWRAVTQVHCACWGRGFCQTCSLARWQGAASVGAASGPTLQCGCSSQGSGCGGEPRGSPKMPEVANSCMAVVESCGSHTQPMQSRRSIASGRSG